MSKISAYKEWRLLKTIILLYWRVTTTYIQDIQALHIWRKLVWYSSHKIVVTHVSVKGHSKQW
jgi:hypothetical protein